VSFPERSLKPGSLRALPLRRLSAVTRCGRTRRTAAQSCCPSSHAADECCVRRQVFASCCQGGAKALRRAVFHRLRDDGQLLRDPPRPAANRPRQPGRWAAEPTVVDRVAHQPARSDRIANSVHERELVHREVGGEKPYSALLVISPQVRCWARRRHAPWRARLIYVCLCWSAPGICAYSLFVRCVDGRRQSPLALRRAADPSLDSARSPRSSSLSSRKMQSCIQVVDRYGPRSNTTRSRTRGRTPFLTNQQPRAPQSR